MFVGVVIVLLFFAFDFALVLGALYYLSERRGLADMTNLRYREQRRRYKP